MSRFVTGASRNLHMLMEEINPAWRSVMRHDSVKITFLSRKFSGLQLNRYIALNREEFSRFEWSPTPSADQRWALATLKEEIVHYLGSKFRFDQSKRWKIAVRADLSRVSPRRDRLFQDQRTADSSNEEIKLTPAECADGRTLVERIRTLFGYDETAVEMLPDIILIRDFIARAGKDASAIMRPAFPATFPLMLEFEALVEIHAARRAAG